MKPENKHYTIVDLLELQVIQNPNNTVLIDDSNHLTYLDFNAKVNQLAHYLKTLGVGADTFVAISLERSFELMVGLLAILKAGGCYVPIDYNQPADRLNFLLEDTQAPILITQSHLEDHFSFYQGQLLNIDSEWDRISLHPTNNLATYIPLQSLAYVIYTSGSTGKPKGVMVEHQNLINYLNFCQYTYGIEQKCSAPLHSSIAFDMSITSLFFPIIVGGEIHLINEGYGVESIQKLMNNKKSYSFIKLTPSHLKLIKQQNSVSQITNKTRILIVGGETLLASDINFWRESSPNLVIYNEYGPTESTVGCSIYKINPGDHCEGNIPIGKPIINTQLYILDKYKNRVPVGVIGELYIGGAGLARGYLNQSKLTDERFIENPFISSEDKTAGKNARLYRTGDLARYLSDGNIEYLGRVDDQVKLRGYRIELGEIESIISEHINVAQAVVVLNQNESGQSKLVGYVTSNMKPGQKVSIEHLQDFLKKKLPDYMIPSTIIQLDNFPLTANGKLDKKALPSPDINQVRMSGKHVAPSSEIEKQLAAIWSEVLRVDNIGIHDNFFQIGGDSIISIQVISKARQQNIALEITDIFEKPTIAELINVATIIEEQTPIKIPQQIVIGSAPLIPIQRWFFSQPHIQVNHFNQAVLLEIQSDANQFDIKTALIFLLKHHDALRFRFKKIDKFWEQHCEGLDIIPQQLAFDDIDLSHLEDIDQQRKALEFFSNQSQGSLNIIEGPLVKAILFRHTKNQPQKLLIIIHHLIMDGISWRILLEDLALICDQMKQNKDLELPPKTNSYRDWGLALESYALNEKILKELPYWQRVVSASDGDFPSDFDRGVNNVDCVQSFSLSLDQEKTQRMLQQAPAAFRTQVNDILLTALVLACGNFTGCYQLKFSLDGHGRENLFEGMDISRTIGWFTSLFPVYLTIEDPSHLANAIKSIKEQLRQIPNRGIGYGILKYLSINKISSDSLSVPTGQEPKISFNYLGQWDSSIKSKGLFQLSNEPIGLNIAANNARAHLLEINCEVVNGRLHVSIEYSTQHFYFETIQNLAQTFMQRLNELIDYCCTDSIYGYTSSDFPLSQLNQHKLDQIFGSIPDIEDIYPLSPMQSGLLFRKMYLPESDVYYIQTVFEIKGGVNSYYLQQIWQAMINQFSILRTGIIWKDLDKPLQFVKKNVELPWIELDWSHLSDYQFENELRLFLNNDRNQPLNLNHPPLIRLFLIKLSHDHYYLVWGFHHVILDGWCTPIIVKTLLTAYRQLQSGEAIQLAYTNPYRNYIAWLMNQNIKATESFWQDFLNDAKPSYLSEKSYFKKVGKTIDTSYKEYALNLDDLAFKQLREFSKARRLTTNTLIQGAWAIVLGHYLRQNNVVFGVTLSGRSINLPGVDAMVGLFINTLPLSVNLQSNQELNSFLIALQESMVKLYNHGFISLAKIHSLNKIEESLFDTLILFENYPDEEWIEQKDAIDIKVIDSIEKTEYPLTIAISQGCHLNFKFHYETSYFDDEFIHHLARTFITVFKGIISDQNIRLSQIATMPENDIKKLIYDFNSQSKFISPVKNIVEAIQKQVQQFPEAIALIDKQKVVSYLEMNQRANRIANYLLTVGCSSETLVGISLTRSINYIICILAVLKAGGAFVPIDPNYPDERIQFILTNAGINFTITETQYEDKYSSYLGSLIVIDAFEEQTLIDSFSSENPEINIGENQLAYIIYTSGSTGVPKGVMLEHAGLANLAYSEGPLLQIDKNSVVLQFASMSFDASVWEWSGALTHGARLCILPDSTKNNLDDFEDFIVQQQITIATLPPSILKTLNPTRFPSLKTLVTAGEVCSEKLKETWINRVRLINAYGPSEATVCASANIQIAGNNRSAKNIGKPIHNMKIYILDQFQRPMPIGVKGELWIGGIGVARGYLNNSNLTQERFIIDPFTPESSTRLYQSGDIGRYLSDGSIEYIGREDNQVKVRGFRIELGEIEQVIASYSGVQEVAVILQAEEEKTQQLIGFIVWEGTLSEKDKLQQNSDLEKFLLAKLPKHMVPNCFIVLEKMPLTSNGKIDHQRLLLLKQSEINEHKTEIFYPQNNIEANLLKIWCELLNVEQVGLLDNFFQMGGDSILAIQFVSKAQQNGIQMDISDIFDNPTFQSLASRVSSDEECHLIPANLDNTLHEIPLSFAQQRMWFLQHILSNSIAYNIVIPMQMSGNLDKSALHEAFNKLIARHEILRTALQISDKGEPFQCIRPNIEIKINEIDRMSFDKKKQKEEIESVIHVAAQHHFDLTKPPLIYVSLIRLMDDNHILIIVMHHIISDGWSSEIFCSELSHYYNASLKKLDDKLPELSIQYKDFALWQRAKFQGQRLQKQLDYWLHKLDGIPEISLLYTDYIRPREVSLRGAQYSFSITKDKLDYLRKISDDHNCTIFMVVLALFKVLLQRYSQSTDIVIGSPIAGRHYSGVERLIGFFANTLALRTDCSGNPTFIELLQRVRKTSLEAYQNQDIPFEYLVEKLQLSRDLSYHPIFQIMFIYQNFQPLNFQFDGLEIDYIDFNRKDSKFDLTLHAHEFAGGIQFSFEYSVDLFNSITIQNMAEHLLLLVNEISLNPNKPIMTYNLLTEQEREQILFTCSKASLNKPTHTVVELFLKQVQSTPKRTAIIEGDTILSYDQLNQNIERYLILLSQKKLDPGSIVAVCLPRSMELIVCLFAILRLGLAFLPLDTDLPEERIKLFIDDAKAKLIITYNEKKDIFNDNFPQLITIEQIDKQLSTLLDLANEYKQIDSIDPSNLAYIIYTSGSTGKPKGVMGHHLGLVNRLLWLQDVYPFQENEVCVFKTPVGFIDAITEMFQALLFGAGLLISKKGGKDPIELANQIGNHGVTRIVMVPSLLNALLEMQSLHEKLASLKTIIVSGEELIPSIVERVRHLFPSVKLLNFYGSSEVVGDVTYHEITKQDLFRQRIPIGKPIANTQIYILDQMNGLCPVGVPGEICVGGFPVAIGYLNSNDLNQSKFFLNSFIGDPNQKLYRTADRGRYLMDGTIEYLGRVDNPIKIRGFRVDLVEIENALLRHRFVETAIVLIRKNNIEENNLQLIAYIKLKNQLSVINNQQVVDELHQFLSDFLPEYMVPNEYTILDQFPINNNGKIDRNKLITQRHDSVFINNHLQYPKNHTEFMLTKIWQELLNKKIISVTDNFFKIGGHSLLIVKMALLIESQLNKKISISEIYKYPTIQKLANHLNKQFDKNSNEALIVIQQQGRGVPLFLIHPISGLSFIYNALSFYIQNHPIYGINNPNFGDSKNLFNSLEHMAEQYLDIVMPMCKNNKFILGGWSFGGVVALEMARQLKSKNIVIDNVIMIDSYYFYGNYKMNNRFVKNKMINEFLTNENITPSTEEARLFTNELENNCGLLENYCLNDIYDGKVTLLKASDSDEASVYYNETTFNGWKKEYIPHLVIDYIPGKHQDLFKLEFVKPLANKIIEIINQKVHSEKEPHLIG